MEMNEESILAWNIIEKTNNHGFSCQVGAKHSLARTVEVVAVCQSYHILSLTPFVITRNPGMMCKNTKNNPKTIVFHSSFFVVS